MNIKTMLDYTGQILQIDRFRDYCPNGLQIEGRQEIRHIVSGVSASMALLEAAQAAGADMILVHHGYFWRNEAPQITGLRRQRIRYLLSHDLNLVAYHLPLDQHAELGNNAQLARLLGLQLEGWSGSDGMVAYGTIDQPLILRVLGKRVETRLGRAPLLIGQPEKQIQRIAWCTGAAQQYIETAIELGVDAFISGEVSEQTFHLARESGVAYIAAGHHATERYGVQALGAHLAERYGLTHAFIDIENPV